MVGLVQQDPLFGVRWVCAGLLVFGGIALLCGWVYSLYETVGSIKVDQQDGPVPSADEERREFMRRVESRLATPEDAVRHEKMMANLEKTQPALAAAHRALTLEERSWLTLAQRLSGPNVTSLVCGSFALYLVLALAFVGAGIWCWRLPALYSVVALIGAFALLIFCFKCTSRILVAAGNRPEADLVVARLLDDPGRYLELLHRLEAAEAETDHKKTGLPPVLALRRKAVEESLAG
jgi:hypothetical protein